MGNEQTSSIDEPYKQWSCNVLFIWRGRPVLSFSEKLSRYQNSEINWCLNVIALSNSDVYIRSL